MAKLLGQRSSTNLAGQTGKHKYRALNPAISSWRQLLQAATGSDFKTAFGQDKISCHHLQKESYFLQPELKECKRKARKAH